MFYERCNSNVLFCVYMSGSILTGINSDLSVVRSWWYEYNKITVLVLTYSFIEVLILTGDVMCYE